MDELDGIFPEGRGRKSVVSRLPDPRTGIHRLRLGFDNDPGSWHNRLVGYRPAEYELVYVLRGRGTLTDARGRRHAVGDGTVVQRLPGLPSTLRYDPPEQGVVTCFLVVPAELHALACLGTGWDDRRPVLPHPRDDRIIDELRACHRVLRDAGPQAMDRVVVRILEGLGRCLRCLADADQDGDDERRLLDRACALLASPEGVAPAGIAARLGLSEYALRALFHRRLRTTPGQYRIARKMERACDLLAAGRLHREVAAELGFADACVFARRFKRCTGVTPTAWRARL